MFRRVVVMNMSTFSGDDSGTVVDEPASDSTPRAFSGLFTQRITAANTRTSYNENGGDYGYRAEFRALRDAEDSVRLVNQKGKRKKGKKKRKNKSTALPPVGIDEYGDVYLPASETNNRPQLHRQQGGRKALPPAERNSVGDVYLPGADRARVVQRQRLSDPADSSRTRSSVILGQYFSDSRLPTRLNSLVADERDHPTNEQDSVSD